MASKTFYECGCMEQGDQFFRDSQCDVHDEAFLDRFDREVEASNQHAREAEEAWRQRETEIEEPKS
jgi:hypothetical protein